MNALDLIRKRRAVISQELDRLRAETMAFARELEEVATAEAVLHRLIGTQDQQQTPAGSRPANVKNPAIGDLTKSEREVLSAIADLIQDGDRAQDKAIMELSGIDEGRLISACNSLSERKLIVWRSENLDYDLTLEGRKWAIERCRQPG